MKAIKWIFAALAVVFVMVEVAIALPPLFPLGTLAQRGGLSIYVPTPTPVAPPVALVGAPTTATSSSTICTVNVPAGTQTGNALFAFVFGGNATIMDNASMTDLGTSTATGTGWYVDLRGLIVPATVPSSITFTIGTNQINFCELMAFTGVRSPIALDPASGNPSTVAASSLIPGSAPNGLTSTSPGDLMFFGVGETIGSGTIGTFGAPSPNLVGGTWANGIQSSTSAQTTEMWWSLQSAVGQTGTISSTLGCPGCANTRNTGSLWSVLANGGAPTLSSIAVAPNPASITGIGNMLQFGATGTYSDGSMQSVTSQCNPWMSANTAIATINSSGLATAVAAGGPINITCTIGAIVGTSPLTVATAPPLSLVQQHAANTGSAGTTSITSACTTGNTVILVWNAIGATGAATGVSNLGNAAWTKVAAGAGSNNSDSEIWATTCGSTPGSTSTVTLVGTIANFYYNMSEWAGLTAVQDSGSPTSSNTSFIPPTLTTTTAKDLLIAITGTTAGPPSVPGAPWVALSTSSAFAPGVYQSVTSTGAYTASYSGGTGSGQSSALAAFKTAGGGGTPTLTMIAVTPSSATITGIGNTQQFTATGTYSDNSTANVTSSCNPWASSNTSIATIGASTGLAMSVAAGGPINITCTIGTIAGTASLTVGTGGQVANSMCFQTNGTSAYPRQWAGAGCTVAFTVPSRPAITSPQIWQDGVQRTYGSTTCTPVADSNTAHQGTDNTACMFAALNAGNVEVYPPTSAHAGNAYLIIGDLDVPSNRTLICCTDPAGNCSSTSNNYNDQGGTVAFEDNPALVNSTIFALFFDNNRGATCPSGNCGNNDTIYGCQFRGAWYGLSAPPGNQGAGNKVMVWLNDGSTGDSIILNDFEGEPGLVGPIDLADGNVANGALNTLIEWNVFRNAGNNDVEITASRNLQLLHNSSINASGWFENNTLAGVCGDGPTHSATDAMTNNLLEWNSNVTTDGGMGFCQQASGGSNPPYCNGITGGFSCCHGSSGCNSSHMFDYSGNKIYSNAVIGNQSTSIVSTRENGSWIIPSIYFDNLCNSSVNCGFPTPSGFNFTGSSCTLPSQNCSNQ